MKHWDLMPGERVILTPGNCDDFTPRGLLGATYRFRTTKVACFTYSDGGWIELKLRSDGSLRDTDGKPWHVAGPDRDTRVDLRPGITEDDHLEAERRRVKGRAAALKRWEGHYADPS